MTVRLQQLYNPGSGNAYPQFSQMNYSETHAGNQFQWTENPVFNQSPVLATNGGIIGLEGQMISSHGPLASVTTGVVSGTDTLKPPFFIPLTQGVWNGSRVLVLEITGSAAANANVKTVTVTLSDGTTTATHTFTITATTGTNWSKKLYISSTTGLGIAFTGTYLDNTPTVTVTPESAPTILSFAGNITVKVNLSTATANNDITNVNYFLIAY